MPKPNAKPNQVVNTQPTPGLLRRLFGGGPSEQISQEWPQLAQAWATRSAEMPNETGLAGSVRPMNMYEKFASGGAHAITWPWGSIALNRDSISQDNVNLPQLLTHELTHVGQRPTLLSHLQNTIRNSLSGMEYQHRPEESEALNAEQAYRPPRDIYLKPEGVDTAPSFAKRKLAGK